MRRLLAIFFLLLFTSTSEAAEVFKLPFLVRHWQLHEKEGRITTFFSFLKEHYTTDHNDSDKQQDEGLPFKSMNIDHLMLVFTIEPLPPFKAPLLHLHAIVHSFYPSYFPETNLSGIFHPPRHHSIMLFA